MSLSIHAGFTAEQDFTGDGLPPADLGKAYADMLTDSSQPFADALDSQNDCVGSTPPESRFYGGSCV